MNFRIMVWLGFFAVAGANVRAAPTIIQPNESTSKDGFVYQFLPTFNFDTGGFGALLSSGNTGVGHDTRSFVQFNLTGITLGLGESAKLNLYIGSTASAGFGVNPSTGAPVVTDIYYNTGPWDESTLTWNAQPSIGSIVIDSKTMDAINQWVTFDITSLVQVWLSNPSTNFGLAVVQHAAVSNGGPVVAVYDSSAGTNKPSLQIVPEPEMATMFIITFLVGVWRRWRRPG